MTNLLRGRILPGLMLLIGSVLLAGMAQATVWCGDNGLVRFSFVAGDSLVDVFDAGDPVNGVTKVTVYAWLTDVEPVARNGERFLNLGGIEFNLTVTGAEGIITRQELGGAGRNLGTGMGDIVAGLMPGLRLRDGRALLAVWDVMFQGRPENVRFGLDPAGVTSCRTIEGCAEAAPPALYVGVDSSHQLGDAFGAGYVPGWLNPTGTPDQTPVTGKQSYVEVGRYTSKH